VAIQLFCRSAFILLGALSPHEPVIEQTIIIKRGAITYER
jgi:hypothetical protein